MCVCVFVLLRVHAAGQKTVPFHYYKIKLLTVKYSDNAMVAIFYHGGVWFTSEQPW